MSGPHTPDDLDRLGSYSGEVQALLAALAATGMDGLLLELDGDSRELHDLIDRRTAADPVLSARNRKARRSYLRLGPLTLGGRPLALPVDRDSLAELLDLAHRCAGPEIAICLTVRDRDGTLLIDAPDIGDAEVWVNRDRMGSAVVDAFRDALGHSLTP